MASRKRQAKSATTSRGAKAKRSKSKRLRVPLSNPGKPKRTKTMAKKKGTRKGHTKLHGAAAAAHAKAKKRSNPGKPRKSKSKAKRRSHGGGLSVTTRVRRNPPSMGWKRLATMTAMVVVGGGAGVLAARQVEAHVAQPPTTIGLLEIGLAGLGLFAALKLGQPLIGLGFAAGAGAQGALSLAGQATSAMGAGAATPAAMPAVPGMPALPPGAPSAFGYQDGTPFGMGALVDVGDDINGHEGVAAIEEATDVDEDGNPVFDDPINPYTGSDVAYS